jgi:hypothetical protein
MVSGCIANTSWCVVSHGRRGIGQTPAGAPSAACLFQLSPPQRVWLWCRVDGYKVNGSNDQTINNMPNSLETINQLPPRLDRSQRGDDGGVNV